MTINWILIGFLFCLCLPGVFIALPRVINFLLQDNTETIKLRFKKLAIAQTLILILVLCVAGGILSRRTGLNAPVFEALLQGRLSFESFTAILLPALIGAIIALGAFCLVYYGLMVRTLDAASLSALNKFRSCLGLSGCILYGGIVEEVIARWGLMNLTAFFMLMMVAPSDFIYWCAIFTSGLLFVVGQIPVYIAIGCTSSRRFYYTLVLASLCQSLVYGYLFWHYGLLCAMMAHMLFHLAWSVFDSKLSAKA